MNVTRDTPLTKETMGAYIAALRSSESPPWNIWEHYNDYDYIAQDLVRAQALASNLGISITEFSTPPEYTWQESWYVLTSLGPAQGRISQVA